MNTKSEQPIARWFRLESSLLAANNAVPSGRHLSFSRSLCARRPPRPGRGGHAIEFSHILDSFRRSLPAKPSPSRLPFKSYARLIKRRPMNRDSGLRIGKLFGIPLYLHPFWHVILATFTYHNSLQSQQQHPLWTDTQHWTVGVLT